MTNKVTVGIVCSRCGNEADKDFYVAELERLGGELESAEVFPESGHGAITMFVPQTDLDRFSNGLKDHDTLSQVCAIRMIVGVDERDGQDSNRTH